MWSAHTTSFIGEWWNSTSWSRAIHAPTNKITLTYGALQVLHCIVLYCNCIVIVWSAVNTLKFELHDFDDCYTVHWNCNGFNSFYLSPPPSPPSSSSSSSSAKYSSLSSSQPHVCSSGCWDAGSSGRWGTTFSGRDWKESNALYSRFARSHVFVPADFCGNSAV